MLTPRLQAGSVSGSLDLNYQDGHSRTDDQESVATRAMSENLNLDYEGSLYRSWVGTLNLGSTFGRTTADRSGVDTTTTLDAYRMQGNLFPYSPFPLAFYAVENRTGIGGDGVAGDGINTRMFGADLRLDFQDLPTTTIFHYGQETTSSLSALQADQSSDTTGVGLKKQWRDATSLLRYEHSDYQEKLSAAEAQADRVTASWTYRPSGAFQASAIGSLYERAGNNPAAQVIDPLYSNRQSDSANLSALWNPGAGVNVSVSSNYFVEDYGASQRRADDARLAADYLLTPNWSLSVSGYTIQTTVDGKQFNSRDARAGATYARHGVWHGAEVRGSLAAGYFIRSNVADSVDGAGMRGGFYQIAGGVERALRGETLTVTPYCDLSYGRNLQTVLAETVTSSQEPGIRADSRVGGGQLTGSVSYRQTRQTDGMEITSRQRRAYLDFSHGLGTRGNFRIQTGYSQTDGQVIDSTFAGFTADSRTDLKTSYLRGDVTAPLLSTGLMWRNSARANVRIGIDGREERTWSFESNLTQQFGMLFYEFGYAGRWNDQNGLGSTESLWYVRARRPFTFRF
jgi:hypothetical protein